MKLISSRLVRCVALALAGSALGAATARADDYTLATQEGFCVDATYAPTTVELPCSNATAPRWDLRPLDIYGHYKIASTANGRCLDTDGNWASGSRIMLRACKSLVRNDSGQLVGDSQTWLIAFDRMINGMRYYDIVSMSSGNCLMQTPLQWPFVPMDFYTYQGNCTGGIGRVWNARNVTRATDGL